MPKRTIRLAEQQARGVGSSGVMLVEADWPVRGGAVVQLSCKTCKINDINE